MEVFIVAGEPSGDRQGAALAQALREREPQAFIAGVGGHAMEAAGVNLLFRSAGWAAIGVGEALKKVPGLWLKQQAIRRHLLRHSPDVLVLIDFGAFNLRLARGLQGSGIPILYYFPPRSWSRQPPTGGLTDLVDAIATPFPWSRQALEGGRAQVRWVGHPLVDQVQPRLSAAQARARWRLTEDERLVLVAPGSRAQEIRYLLAPLVEAAALLKRRLSGLRFAVSAAPGVRADMLSRRFQRAGIEPIVVQSLDPDLLQVAHVALVTSGTATLELAILGVPMVVVYKVSPLTRLQYEVFRLLRGPLRFVAMPNVIAQRAVVPEALQQQARAEVIAAEARRLLEDRAAWEQMRQDLREIVAQLGPPGATARTAAMALALARREPIANELDASCASR